MEFARLTRLRRQIGLGAVQRALQVALHRGHVVDRFGHHAGQFLNPGKAVKLQRIEAALGLTRMRQPRLHLQLGLQFNVAQLVAQALQIARQVFQRPAHLSHAGLDARASHHDLTGLVDHAVEQLCTNAHLLPARRRLRGYGRRAGHDRHSGKHGARLPCWVWLRGIDRRGRRAQLIEMALQRVKFRQQFVQLVRLRSLVIESFDHRFHAVRALAQTHRTGQSRAAFQRVQHAQHLGPRAEVVGSSRPLAQGAAEHGQQLGRLVLEDVKQVSIQLVDRFKALVRIKPGFWHCLWHGHRPMLRHACWSGFGHGRRVDGADHGLHRLRQWRLRP